MYALLIYPMRATCPAYLTVLDFILLIFIIIIYYFYNLIVCGKKKAYLHHHWMETGKHLYLTCASTETKFYNGVPVTLLFCAVNIYSILLMTQK
jgi:hypothetical protein